MVFGISEGPEILELPKMLKTVDEHIRRNPCRTHIRITQQVGFSKRGWQKMFLKRIIFNYKLFKRISSTSLHYRFWPKFMFTVETKLKTRQKQYVNTSSRKCNGLGWVSYKGNEKGSITNAWNYQNDVEAVIVKPLCSIIFFNIKSRFFRRT